MSAHPFSMKRRGVWLVAVLLGASCYTGPVNMRPTISILPAAPFSRGDSPTYKATALDPEDGLLPSASIEWVAKPKACPDEAQRRENWPQSGWTKGSAEFAVPAALTVAKFCVWARATDRYGAMAIAVWPGDPNNHAPVARLRRTPSTSAVPLRTLITYTTEDSTDPDGDNLQTTEWRIEGHPELSFQTCPGSEPSDRNKQCFMAEAPGEYLIVATVSDGMAVTPIMNLVTVQPGNVPIARLDLKTPLKADSYPLGTLFHLSGANSSDNDPSDLLDPTWEKVYTLEAPNLARDLEDCDLMFSPLERCFRADAPGTYHVSFKVSDGTSDSVPETMDLKVLPDAPPCLRLTEPAMSEATVQGHVDPENPVKWFKVLRVEDDQDPYPPVEGGDAIHDRTTFRWYVNGKPAWGDFATFPLSTDAYLYGEEVSVRLEIFDRVTSTSQLQTCVTDICKTSDTCVQRMTWKVKFVP